MKKRKKTKIKRLKANEILLVAEMQRKIDYYERFLLELSTMIWTRKVQFILEGEYSDEECGEIYKFVRKKIEEENENREHR